MGSGDHFASAEQSVLLFWNAAGVGALAEVENICAEVRDMLDDLPRS